MKWYTKLIVILSLLALAVCIGGMVYVVSAKNTMNEYTIQSGAAFNAAMLINAEETYTDPERAVIAEYNGQRAVAAPENYKQILYYLRCNAGSPLIPPTPGSDRMTVNVCGQSVFTVGFEPDGENAVVQFETGGRTFRMHVHASYLKRELLRYALEGTGEHQSIPLE